LPRASLLLQSLFEPAEKPDSATRPFFSRVAGNLVSEQVPVKSILARCTAKSSKHDLPDAVFPRWRISKLCGLRVACAQPILTLLFTVTALSGQSDTGTLLERARTSEKVGNYRAAEQAYLEALAVKPGDLETLKRLGVLQQTELKFQESIQNFKQVLDRDPQYSEVNFFIGVSYFGENELEEAIRSFERELASARPHPRCRYYLALTLQSAGRPDEATAQLDREVQDNPKDLDALYQLARIHKNASLLAIEKLKAQDSDSFQLHALMGELHADEERYSEAIREYQAALAKRPDATGMHYAIGVAYWAQHQLDAAKKEFTESLKESPNDGMTNLYLGDIAVHEEHFAEALGYLLVAQKGQPEMAQVHLLLGKSYHGQHQPDKAKEEFLAAIRFDPAAAQPHYLLAQVYRELHDPQASASEFAEFERLSKLEKEKASKLNPVN
jgi:tetratricopeptide (TPR) repeat protein